MLVDEPLAMKMDPILTLLAEDRRSKRIEQGCYQTYHFGSSAFLPGYKHYPELSIGPYGVCDSLEQIKQQCPELDDPERQFVVTLTEVRKDTQPLSGGWRWHKWGQYIGDHEIKHEYLVDEDIERVFCYQIYEKEQPSRDSQTPVQEERMLPLRQVIMAVEVEEEFDGDVPADVFELAAASPEDMAQALRIACRLTKQNIKQRIEALD